METKPAFSLFIQKEQLGQEAEEYSKMLCRYLEGAKVQIGGDEVLPTRTLTQCHDRADECTCDDND